MLSVSDQYDSIHEHTQGQLSLPFLRGR